MGQRARRIMGRGGALAIAIGLVALTMTLTGAHERRDVANGQYRLVVGFLNEPAITGEQNGLSLRVSRIGGATGTPLASPAAGGTPAAAELAPVEGLQDFIEAEVIYGDQRMPLALSASFGDPGHYESIFFPMAAGDYSFRITGTIEDTPIDETFTSGLDTFSSVLPVEPLQFPKPAASPAALTLGDPVGNVGQGGGLTSGLGGTGVAALVLAATAAGAGWMVSRRRLATTR